MRRRLAGALLFGLVLAGCTGPRSPADGSAAALPVSVYDPPPGNVLAPRPSVAFLPAGDVIQVDFAADRPAQRVELVAPSGARIPAMQIVREQDYLRTLPPPGAFGGEGKYHPWFGRYGYNPFADTGWGMRGPLTRFGVVLPPPGPRYPRGRLYVRNLARIPVPDLAAYRAGWPDWRIRVYFDAGADAVEYRELRAPAPPA